MTTPADVSRDALQMIQYVVKNLERSLVGRSVRVTSNHNGQPFGRSRKPWTGEVCKIKQIYVDIHNGVSLVLEGHEWECLIPANEVEFVSSNADSAGDSRG